MTSIPLVDLKTQYLSIKDEIDASIFKVLDKTDFIQGDAVRQFEKAFAEKCGSLHCIGVGNGTDALSIVLKSMGIGTGHSVITVANSFIASSEAITTAGARPIFVDCDPNTYNIDLAKLEQTLEEESKKGTALKAIIPVHLYGRAADMTSIMKLARKYQLKVIEDCAQAHFAKHNGKFVGNFGDAATFSFYPGKNLGAFGDAGCILTQDEELALAVKKYSNHGRIAKYDHEIEGINSRLDTIQASVLLVKLKYIDKWTEQRIEIAKSYQKHLSGLSQISLPSIPTDNGHVFHLYVIRLKNRNEVLDRLKEMGVQAGVHYPIALPNLKAYSYLNHSPAQFPIASQYQDEILSLPLYPEMTEDQIIAVASRLKQAIQ